MTTELARIESITPAELFKPGTLDPILERIRAEVRREAACLDISTEANRKAIASLAYKVKKSKTFVDGQRVKLVSDEKARLKIIDREGGRLWDAFEELEKEVRKPLTDWENAEKERVANHEAALKELVDAGAVCELNWNNPGWNVGMAHSRLAAIMASTYDWQEFHSRAVATVTATIRQIKDAIAKREKYDAEQEELTRLRAEQAKRDQEAREAQIAKEATERAEWEAKRREEAAATAAQAAQERVEREKAEAEARAKQAEAQRAQLEQQAKAQAEAAAQSAARAAKEAAERQERAVVAERQRAAADIAEATRKEEEAQAKREASKRHVAKINREVRDALMEHSKFADFGPAAKLSKEQAQEIVQVVAQGLIPHLTISY